MPEADEFARPITPEQLRPPAPLRDADHLKVAQYDNQDISFINHLQADSSDEPSLPVSASLAEHELFSLAFP